MKLVIKYGVYVDNKLIEFNSYTTALNYAIINNVEVIDLSYFD